MSKEEVSFIPVSVCPLHPHRSLARLAVIAATKDHQLRSWSQGLVSPLPGPVAGLSAHLTCLCGFLQPILICSLEQHLAHAQADSILQPISIVQNKGLGLFGLSSSGCAPHPGGFLSCSFGDGSPGVPSLCSSMSPGFIKGGICVVSLCRC